MKKLLTSLLLALSFSVSAGKPHHDHTEVATPVVNETYTTIYNSKGVASAIAQAQCHFDRSTYDEQGCFSVGNYDSTTAFNFGFGKRLNKKGDLLNFSISAEGGDMAFGAGYNFRF